MEQRSVEKSTETVLISSNSNYEKYFANQNKEFDLFLESKKQAFIKIVILVRNESK